MAKMEVKGFDVLNDLLKELSHPEVFAKEAVNEAAKILEDSTRKAVKASTNSDNLAGSFSATPAKENDLGVYSVVRPTGTHHSGLENSKLAAIFEYGRRGGYQRADMSRAATTMEPRPWRAKAINGAKSACEAIIEKKIGEAIAKAGGGS